MKTGSMKSTNTWFGSRSNIFSRRFKMAWNQLKAVMTVRMSDYEKLRCRQRIEILPAQYRRKTHTDQEPGNQNSEQVSMDSLRLLQSSRKLT
jgi:hypothetical protein